MKEAEIIGVVAGLATIYGQVKTLPSSESALMAVVLLAVMIIKMKTVK